MTKMIQKARIRDQERPARNVRKHACQSRAARRSGLSLRGGRGQTMILTVLLLSSAILSATAISALLVLFQLRQVSDIKASTQAIFAADAGIECVLYEAVVNEISGSAVEQVCIGQMEDNSARYRVVYESATGSYKSIGQSGRTARALEITF